MSSEAVTARLKRACGLGDAERRATMVRSAVAEISREKTKSVKSQEVKKK